MNETNAPSEQDHNPKIKPLRKLARSFWRLSISQKMHLGFFPLVLIFIISLFALTKLNQLNRLNASILQVNIPAHAVLEKMRGTIFDQESFIRRYTILKDRELLKIQQDLNREFIKGLDTLRAYPLDLHLPLGALDESYADYTATLLNGIKLVEESPAFGQEFDQQVRQRQIDVIDNLSLIAEVIAADQNAKSEISAATGDMAFNAALALCVVGILISAAAATIVTRNIVGAVKKLQVATVMISQGNFDYRADIRNKDELGELSEAFAMMATRLKNLEEMYLDASPLTRLPGGVAIENILKKKIEHHKLFAFCLMDIDNFKSFNDHYGYAKGNELIQNTAAIIERAVAAQGNSDDFIGHIGGDDFVVITTPDRCEQICADVVEEFDATTPDFYGAEDRNRGYIIGENRQGQEVKFPLASISVAVVSNQTRPLKNHIQVGEIAAEIKEHAKSISGSAIFIDQRQFSVGRWKNPKVVNFPERKQA